MQPIAESGSSIVESEMRISSWRRRKEARLTTCVQRGNGKEGRWRSSRIQGTRYPSHSIGYNAAAEGGGRAKLVLEKWETGGETMEDERKDDQDNKFNYLLSLVPCRVTGGVITSLIGRWTFN